MRFPRWIRRYLDSLPDRDEVMSDMEAKRLALQEVECLNCTGDDLAWIPSLDGDVIGCLNCFHDERIVKKARR